MKKEERVNLGKRTIWTFLECIVALPFWLLSVSPTKKSWSEFTHGMIKHDHQWDYEHPGIEHGQKYYPCKHYGCSFVTTLDKDGTWAK